MERRTRRKFAREYKAEVVNLFRTSGKTVAQFCKERDLTESVLRNWLRPSEIDEKKSPHGPLTTEERAEMARLRRELKTVTMERDFLKKLQPSSPGAHDDVCARLGGGSCLPEGAHEPGPWPVPFRASCIPHAKGVTTCAGPTKA